MRQCKYQNRGTTKCRKQETASVFSVNSLFLLSGWSPVLNEGSRKSTRSCNTEWRISGVCGISRKIGAPCCILKRGSVPESITNSHQSQELPLSRLYFKITTKHFHDYVQPYICWLTSAHWPGCPTKLHKNALWLKQKNTFFVLNDQ